MKSFKIVSSLFFLLFSLIILGEDIQRIEQCIAKKVDGEITDFSFFYRNNTNSSILAYAFYTGGHYLSLITEKEHERLAIYVDPGVLYNISHGDYFVNCDDLYKTSLVKNRQDQSVILSWYIRICNHNLEELGGYLKRIYLAASIDSNMDYFHLKQKDGVFAEIIKLMDGNNLSFALLFANHTSKKIVLTDLYGDGNQVKLKFPNGRIFTPSLKKDAKNIELKPGESKTFKIELDQLLKENKDFSMKDFEFGLTELVWEIKLDKEQTITRNFWLVKFNGGLPEAHAGSGYKLDGPLTLETFRDKKISALPAPHAYFRNKEDVESETKETTGNKESSQK